MKIFRQYYQKSIPDDAVIVTQNGRKFARHRGKDGRSTTTPLTRNGKRLSAKSEVYGVRYRDADGRVKNESTGCRTKEAARQRANDILRRVEREKAGVLTPSERKASDTRRLPFESLAKRYLESLATKITRGKTASENHVSNVRRNLFDLAEALELKSIKDLDVSRFERWRTDELRGKRITPRTIGAKIAAIKAFTNWMHDEDMLLEDPLRKLKKPSEAPTQERRALSPKELQELFNAACRRPLGEVGRRRVQKSGEGSRGWGYERHSPEALGVWLRSPEVEALDESKRLDLEFQGRERALAYRILVATGLRTGELKLLEVRDFAPDDRVIHLRASIDKGGKDREIPIRRDLVAELSTYLQEKRVRGRKNQQVCIHRNPEEKLILVPSHQVFAVDLKAAGIKKRDDRGRVVVMHSLRHTHASLLAASGSSMRIAQASMRHSDPRLTAVRYTDEKMLDVDKAVASLPIPSAWLGDDWVQESGRNEAITLLEQLTCLLTDQFDPTGDMKKQVETLRQRLSADVPILKTC